LNRFFQNIFSPEKRLTAVAVLLAVIMAAVLLGVQVNGRIIRSRTLTQAQIAEGWKAAGIEIAEHTIGQKENFWKLAKEYGVDIDTIVGANPGLGKLSASVGQTVRVPNRKGVLHRTEEGEDRETISGLYKVPPGGIASVNNLRPEHIFPSGLDLFIPGAKPVKLSGEMTALYCLRNLFGSPLPGRITSGMGTRTHPVGGIRGRHTGVDLAAREGTPVAAAAAGTVVQTGEGEYLGKFVVVAHKDSYTSVYGHCSQVLATPGRTVKKGETIAKSGQTGRTTGPHLHFEIRKKGVPQDPLKYLW